MTAQQPESCKRGSGRITMIFLAAEPLFGLPTAAILQKGSERVFPRIGLQARSFPNSWAPFRSLSGLISSKRGLATSILDLHDPTIRFPAARPLFLPSAAWILQERVPCNLTSDLLPFPAAGPLFVPSTAWILQKWAGHWCHLCCFRSHLFESLAAQRGCTYVISLCSFLCSWPWPSV